MGFNSKQFIIWMEKEHPILTNGIRGYFEETGNYPNEWEEKTIIQYNEAKDRLLHEEIKKKYKDKLVKTITESKNVKFKSNRRFIKMYVISIDKLNLDISEEGIINKLQRHLLTDGSGKVDIRGVNSVKTLSKYLKLGYNSLNSKLKHLQELNILKLDRVGNYTDIYLNPMYVMYGERFNMELLEMFDISEDDIEHI